MRAVALALVVFSLVGCRGKSERAGSSDEMDKRILPSNRAGESPGGTSHEVAGKLHREGADYFIVRPDGSRMRFEIARDADVTVDGRRLGPGSIPEGTEVRASYVDKGDVPVVKRLEANPTPR